MEVRHVWVRIFSRIGDGAEALTAGGFGGLGAMRDLVDGSVKIYDLGIAGLG